MNDINLISKEDFKVLITNTAMKMNLSEGIVEKDFWVCWILDYLFNEFKYKDYICFKGGTSLSKVYKCIQRFSEDIDLALDWTVLGILKDDAYQERSNRLQDLFNKNANIKTEDYLLTNWLPIIKKDLSLKIKENFDVYIDREDPQTICFQYPRIYEEASILQNIRLEIGTLAESVPSSKREIKSYIAETYSQFFDNVIQVKVVDVKRTFFEKITILHREANRINGNYPRRYSRHLYDVYKMILNGVGTEALGNLDILKMVVLFKMKFYPCKWALYDDIVIGKCKLIPGEDALMVFSKDY